MRFRRVPNPIGESLEALCRQLEPQSPLAVIQRVWTAAAGDGIAQHVVPVREDLGVLTVACGSAVWANEVTMLGPVLVAAINREVGRDLVVSLRTTARRPEDRSSR